RVGELDVENATEGARLLRVIADVEEVAHYGHLLRLATRGHADPAALAREVLSAHGISVRSAQEMRVTVEDAFVAMVRADALCGRSPAA
ncbi:MAG: hypothetical protein ACREJX_13785, partial [Polyangiaceae bacterium]